MLKLDVLENLFLKSLNPLTILFLWNGSSMLLFPEGSGLLCRMSCHTKAAALTSAPAPHSLREGLCVPACNCKKCSTSPWKENTHSGHTSHSDVGPGKSKMALRMSFLGNNSCLKLGPFPRAWLMMRYWREEFLSPFEQLSWAAGVLLGIAFSNNLGFLLLLFSF